MNKRINLRRKFGDIQPPHSNGIEFRQTNQRNYFEDEDISNLAYSLYQVNTTILANNRLNIAAANTRSQTYHSRTEKW